MKHKLYDKIKNSLISSIAVVLIMTLLQPFGIHSINEYKWLAIAGYGVLTFIGCGISDFITICIFRFTQDPENERYTFWHKQQIVLSLLTILILGSLICSYNALLFTGSIYRGWFYQDGTFTLSYLGEYCLYVAAISVFINIYLAYRRKNATLVHHLQKVTELNQILAERYNATASADAEKDTGQKIIIRGTTKESVELQPDNLLYIEAEGNYANVIQWIAGKTVRNTVRCTMKQIEESFADCPQITRCHRAFMVNVFQIRHLTGNSKGFQLTLNGTDQKVPVSKTYVANIHNLIENQP
jgi:hypothetical protein